MCACVFSALAGVCEELGDVIDNGNASVKKEKRSILKMWTYLAFQLLEAFENDVTRPRMLVAQEKVCPWLSDFVCVATRSFHSTPHTPPHPSHLPHSSPPAMPHQGKRGKKKAVSPSLNGLNWAAEEERVLRLLSCVTDLELCQLWDPPSVAIMDSYSKCVCTDTTSHDTIFAKKSMSQMCDYP